MIIKCDSVTASNGSEKKAAATLTSHLKYLQYRQRNPHYERKKDRAFFHGHSDHIDRRCIQQDLMRERVGGIFYYQLLLIPSHDEPVSDYRQWTRALLHDLEDWFSLELNWYGVLHRNTASPHIHLVLQGTGTDRETGCARPVIFKARDVAYLRQRGRAQSEYELLQLLTEMLRELDQCDMISNDIFQ
jgi:hypothetical protein